MENSIKDTGSLGSYWQGPELDSINTIPYNLCADEHSFIVIKYINFISIIFNLFDKNDFEQ